MKAQKLCQDIKTRSRARDSEGRKKLFKQK